MRAGNASQAGMMALVAVFVATTALGTTGASQRTKLTRAEAQYQHAQRLEAALEARPEDSRTEADYQGVIKAYDQIALITPAAQVVTPSLAAVGRLYEEMGRLFEPDFYQKAIDTYQDLLHKYPHTRHGPEALYAIAKIEQGPLGDTETAEKYLNDLVNKYPSSDQADQARLELAAIDKARQEAQVADAAAAQQAAAAPASTEGGVEGKRPAHVRAIRTQQKGDHTRILIDLDGPVKFRAARVDQPDRVYFDLSRAVLSARHGRRIALDSQFVKAVHAAQNRPDVVRIVLDISHNASYSFSLLRNPYQLAIDVGNQTRTAGESIADAETRPEELPSRQSIAHSISRTPVESPSRPLAEPLTEALAQQPARTMQPAAQMTEATHKLRTSRAVANDAGDATASGDMEGSVTGLNAATGSANATRASRGASPSLAKAVGSTGNAGFGVVDDEPASVATDEPMQPVGHVAAARPLREGATSMTRELGLKIGRIVIDAGHGGFDTGTIGPGGLEEKDLCLDVARRLGRLIERRLPGTAVVYTRDDDSFVPLETRTRIANDKEADLFISIHANSSRDPQARGIEIYYLNFATSPDAVEVAARENALSQESVHQLQDLLKKISLNDKIQESRELAADVDQSLMHQLRLAHVHERDRGVKKAPFVVLIGARMPSVLAEISFLSNPTDEHLLETARFRQRIAMGLFGGIQRYLASLNSLSYNAPKSAASAGRAAPQK